MSYHDVVSRAVTTAALERVEQAMPENDDELEALKKQIVESFGDWFRSGYLDRALLFRRAGVDGFTREALPSVIVAMSYFEATFGEVDSPEDLESVREEIKLWVAAAWPLSWTRELLVNFLTTDVTAFEGWPTRRGFFQITPDQAGNLYKLLLANFLFSRSEELRSRVPDLLEWDDDVARARTVFLDALDPAAWRALERELEHSRERVRAGALLLLLHHPDRETFRRLATRALGDPAPEVRLAAAGLLALEGDRSGYFLLAFGLLHQRWEIRLWCGAALAVPGSELDIATVALALVFEPDEWVRRELRDVVRQSRALESFLKSAERRLTRLERAIRTAVDAVIGLGGMVPR